MFWLCLNLCGVIKYDMQPWDEPEPLTPIWIKVKQRIFTQVSNNRPDTARWTGTELCRESLSIYTTGIVSCCLLPHAFYRAHTHTKPQAKLECIWHAVCIHLCLMRFLLWTQTKGRNSFSGEVFITSYNEDHSSHNTHKQFPKKHAWLRMLNKGIKMTIIIQQCNTWRSPWKQTGLNTQTRTHTQFDA